VRVANDSCRDVRGCWHISCSEPCTDSVPRAVSRMLHCFAELQVFYNFVFVLTSLPYMSYASPRPWQDTTIMEAQCTHEAYLERCIQYHAETSCHHPRAPLHRQRGRHFLLTLTLSMVIARLLLDSSCALSTFLVTLFPIHPTLFVQDFYFKACHLCISLPCELSHHSISVLLSSLLPPSFPLSLLPAHASLSPFDSSSLSRSVCRFS